jgi:hypothetical protein
MIHITLKNGKYCFQTLYLFIFFCFLYIDVFSQSCIVNVDSLKGQYLGECKKGKANGTGAATGIDSYKGNFKNGYPEGYGKYIWKNGNWYEGNWEKGLFDGEGSLHTISKGNAKEFIEQKGFWKRGDYIGINKEPFLIDIFSNKISNVEVYKVANTGDNIIITVKSTTGGGSTLLGGSQIKTESSTILVSNTIAKASLRAIEVQKGSYSMKVEDTQSPIKNKYTLLQVVYPVILFLSIETERVKVEIFEKGNWTINIALDK